MSNIRKIDGTDGPIRTDYGPQDLAEEIWDLIMERCDDMAWAEVGVAVEAVRFQVIQVFANEVWE